VDWEGLGGHGGERKRGRHTVDDEARFRVFAEEFKVLGLKDVFAETCVLGGEFILALEIER
jgi:hypothetical protein